MFGASCGSGAGTQGPQATDTPAVWWEAVVEVMAVGGKPTRNGREWARTLPLLFALPVLFLLMGLMMRACGAGEVYTGPGVVMVSMDGGRGR